MKYAASKIAPFSVPAVPVEDVEESRYVGRVVTTREDFDAALKLRGDVFLKELAGNSDVSVDSDIDEFDSRCVHLVVLEKETGDAVGAYRLNPYRDDVSEFYASGEFDLSAIPEKILGQSVELGRACIDRSHRNSRVLFLLWKVLANYMTATDCRYLFGCCSVFTQDAKVAGDVLAKLIEDGHVDESIPVTPLPETSIINPSLGADPANAEMPPLVQIYMRIGAKVCGEPAIDRDFGTVDYFVIFDVEEINKKYKKMFFGI